MPPKKRAFTTTLNLLIDNQDKKQKISPASSSLSSSSTPKQCVKFFWLDIIPDPIHASRIRLFGKIPVPGSAFASCCMTIQDIPRVLWIEPRSQRTVDWDAVYHEIQDLLQQRGIVIYYHKVVQKHYCFDKDASNNGSHEFLEILCTRDQEPLPMKWHGKTFRRVFGTTDSAIDRFLLERRIMGPCWLDIHDAEPSKDHDTWCKWEFTVPSIDTCNPVSDQPPPPPPISIMSIDLDLSKASPPTIRAAHVTSCTLHLESETWSEFETTTFAEEVKEKKSKKSDEATLLRKLCGRIHGQDPDIFVGHDMVSVCSQMVQRLEVCQVKAPIWSMWGRMRLGGSPRRPLCTGRLICDLLDIAPKIIRLRNYTLSHLLESQHLHHGHDEEDKNHNEQHHHSASHLQMQIVQSLGVVSLTFHSATESGVPWSKALQMNKSQCVDQLLSHAFMQQNYLIPDKKIDKNPNKKTDKKTDQKTDDDTPESYEGGHVLKPKVGWHRKYMVLILDFHSLYPSVIQEFNICWTEAEAERKVGVLPQVMQNLVQRRQAIQQNIAKSNDASQKSRWSIQQLALKLLTNSVYGCLGYKSSRFYTPALAARVTQHGREVLLQTVRDIEEQSYLVLYGDTDSAMVQTRTRNVDEALALGQELIASVNKQHRVLRMGIDGLMKNFLVVQKKQYAAMKLGSNNNWTLEIKGLELIKRNWCPLVQEIGTRFLQRVLSESLEIEDAYSLMMQEVVDTKRKAEMKQLPCEQYIMVCQLQNVPSRYAEPKPVHAQVAIEWLKRHPTQTEAMRRGVFVPFIMCRNGTSSSPAQGRHPDTVRLGEHEPDVEWYMTKQMLPVLSRLVDFLEPTLRSSS